MVEEHKAARDMLPAFLHRFTVFLFVLLLTGGAVWAFMYYFIICLDGCGPYHNSTSVADLDGDGDLDVVLSNLRKENELIYWSDTHLWTNQGNGKFTSSSPSLEPLQYPSVAAGDVDEDGDADLVYLAVMQLSLYMNQGGIQAGEVGVFRRGLGIHPQADMGTPGSVHLGDLNNDGQLDAFVAGCCGMLLEPKGGAKGLPSLAWAWINSKSSQGLPVGRILDLRALGDLPMHPSLGDVDGDGDLDVFAAIQPPKEGMDYISADRVLLNDGMGSFTDSGQLLRTSGEPGSTASALGDLDGDGDLDALVGKAAGAMIWTNQGGMQGGPMGVFTDSGKRLPGKPAEAVFLTDFDADGDLDALVGGKNTATIWWNDGRSGFTDSRQHLRYSERHGLSVGDFNNDGSPDILAAAYSSSYILWLNQGDGRLRKN